MTSPIIGRTHEIKIFAQMLSSPKAEFLTMHGRRRVGKTFLIKNFMQTQDVVFLKATGMKDASLTKQIRHVTDEISQTFYHGTRLEAQKDWLGTFALLTQAIQQAEEKTKPIVLFFDEFPWMATKKSLLLQALDHYWNHLWSDNPRIKLIICGSSSSWIINKIVNNKGGLHNRITKNICLSPFNLGETKAYLNSLSVNLNHNHIIQIYMVTGGIPYYLSHISKGNSAAQVIADLAFSQNSLLLNEFDNLYASLFAEAEKYIDLMRIIAQKRQGIAQTEIIKKSKYFSKGGRISAKLQELEQTGFIISFVPYQHKRQGIYYRLVDEYTLFYLHWLEPIRHKLKKADLTATYWVTLQKLPAWKAWAGYAFEALCFKHLPQIRSALNISADAFVDSWRYAPKKGSSDGGAQIDLLFDRNDDSITLCEIKYTHEPVVINKAIAADLAHKAVIFRERTQTKKQLFWALITANGLKQTAYAEKLAIALVTAEALFQQAK